MYLARAWAARVEGASLSWSLRALESGASGMRRRCARDPNYLTVGEADATHGWSRSVVSSRREVHVDVHGKGGPRRRGRLRRGRRRAEGGAGRRGRSGRRRGDERSEALAPRTRSTDRAQRCWRSVPRRTLTGSARLGYEVPLQLELGYKLRRASLGSQSRRSREVADAFVACSPSCLAAARRAVAQ